jgi:hypothetical protein
LYFYFATFFGLLEDIKVAALYGTLYLLFLSNTKDAQFSCASRKKKISLYWVTSLEQILGEHGKNQEAPCMPGINHLHGKII